MLGRRPLGLLRCTGLVRHSAAMAFTLPRPLQDDDTTAAVEYLRDYFTKKGTDGQCYYTGARFERLGGGGDQDRVAEAITTQDLVAVTMLSVRVPPRSALQILESSSELFSEHLRALPRDLDLVDVDPRLVASDDWAGHQLWKALRALPGIGWVTAGKLAARKRPRLIPVYDAIVRDQVGAPAAFWPSLRDALADNDRGLHSRLLRIREDSGVGEDISALRVFDVVTWMHGMAQNSN